MAKLTPVREIPSFAVIIRAIHERGAAQREALDELARRGLWLSSEQRQQAGLDEITAERFAAATGHQPQRDDLERCNCRLAGSLGHWQCGWCPTCDKPRFLCGHYVTASEPSTGDL